MNKVSVFRSELRNRFLFLHSLVQKAIDVRQHNLEFSHSHHQLCQYQDPHITHHLHGKIHHVPLWERTKRIKFKCTQSEKVGSLDNFKVFLFLQKKSKATYSWIPICKFAEQDLDCNKYQNSKENFH